MVCSRTFSERASSTVGVVREVVRRRGDRPAVARLDHDVDDVGDGLTDLLALVGVGPGHAGLEVEGARGQPVDQRRVGNEAAVPLELADHAAGVHVAFDETVQVVDDGVGAEPVDRIFAEFLLVAAAIVLDERLQAARLLLALGIGKREPQEVADGLEVRAVEPADAVDLRDHAAVFQREAHVQPLPPLDRQAVDLPLGEPPVVEVHGARRDDVVPLGLVGLQGLEARIEDRAAQALELLPQRFPRLQLELRTPAGGVLGGGREHLRREVVRERLGVRVVVVRAVIDPDVLEIVVHRGAQPGVHSLGVTVDLLEEIPDLERVAVILLVGERVARERSAVEVVEQDLLARSELVEARGVDPEHQEILLVLSQALELPHHPFRCSSLGHVFLLRGFSGRARGRSNRGRQCENAEAPEHIPPPALQETKTRILTGYGSATAGKSEDSRGAWSQGGRLLVRPALGVPANSRLAER